MSISRDGRMIDVNPAWLVLHGYKDKGEVLGRDVMEFIHPEDRHILVERRETWPHHDFRSYQIRDIRRDGDIVEIDICASKIALAGQGAILTTIRDISEKKRTEREKKSLEERLARSEKMEAIGTLAGGVAHDLNNILGGMVGYPDLLLMEVPEESLLRRGILTIKQSGEKAAAIVQDLLTLARRGVPVMEPVNLNRIIMDYLRSPEFQKLRSFHPGVTIENELAGELLPVLGSSVHLSKVVMNLVSNAAEAMPCGGTIRIETTNQYVDSAIRGYDHVTEGEYIVLKVTDTGIGIAQKDIKKIFEPFYTKKIMGRSGTGLGMAVVWGTVKDHKGYIDIESVEGRGSTFSLYFPVNRAVLKQEDKKISIEQFLSRGETILVVDDVAEQRELASAMLRKLGYSTETLSSGEEAVEYLKKKPANLVILDMIMDPGIDGLETYRKIAEHRPGQKAIIVSGFAETDRVKEAQKLGAGQYLKKPYTLEKIAIAVRNELDKAA
jgi:PAS domain S-box-containing protein